jgi:hypothetical protein
MKKIVLLLVLLSSVSGIRAGLIDGPQTQEKKTDHVFSVNAGPAWVTSKVYTPRGRFSWRTGLELVADYNCIFSNGLGFGLTVAHNSTSYPDNITMKQLYAGASFVYSGKWGDKWRAKVDAGLGYANCKDDMSTEGGLGLKAAYGIEYKVSRQVGLGLEILSVTSYLGSQTNYYTGEKNERNGVSRLGLTLGLRFYL